MVCLHSKHRDVIDRVYVQYANMRDRDSEASAPPEFPPEQPEADLQPDDDEYGAEELDEEEEGAETTAENAGEASAAAAVIAPDGDAEMAGVEEQGEPAEEEEMSEDGSVDLENESEDELEEELEEEVEGEAADGDDAMEVDEKPADASKPQEVMAH